MKFKRTLLAVSAAIAAGGAMAQVPPTTGGAQLLVGNNGLNTNPTGIYVVAPGQTTSTDGTAYPVNVTDSGTVLTGLAAGTLSATSLESINGSQAFAILNTANAAMNAATAAQTAAQTAANFAAGSAANSVQYNDANHTDVTFGGAGSTTPVGLHNVAVGTAGTDAVNVNQLNTAMGSTLTTANNYTDASSVTTLATANNYTDASSATTLATANSYTDGKTKYFQANSTGAQSVASGTDAVAIGPGTVVAGNSAIAGGLNAIASGDNTVVFGANASGTAAGAVAVGAGSQATAAGATAMGQGAVAAGANSTAVGSGANAALAGDVAVGAGASATGVAGVGSAVAIGAGNKATGAGAVAIGDPSVATGQGAVAAGFNSIATADGTATGGAADGAIAMGNASIAAGQGSVALGNQSSTGAAGGIAIGDTARALLGNGIAFGTGATATNAGDVALGAGSTTATAVATTGTTINSIAYSFAGTTPASTVSVGAVGAERTVTNVAAGQLTASSTDAVNGSQLYATNRAVDALGTNVNTLGTSTANNFGGGSTYNSTTGAITAPAYTVNQVTYNNVGSAIDALGSTVAGNNTSNLAPAHATAPDSVAVGAGSVADRANTVSFGTAGAERQLANVAAGTQATDAVNLGQLQAAGRDANQYTDRQIEALDAKTKKQMSGVGAMAMAVSALQPNARAEGNFSVSAAAGAYGGEGAIAAGVNYYVSNQVLVNARIGVTSSGPAKVGAAVGVTWGF